MSNFWDEDKPVQPKQDTKPKANFWDEDKPASVTPAPVVTTQPVVQVEQTAPVVAAPSVADAFVAAAANKQLLPPGGGVVMPQQMKGVGGGVRKLGQSLDSQEPAVGTPESLLNSLLSSWYGKDMASAENDFFSLLAAESKLEKDIAQYDFNARAKDPLFPGDDLTPVRGGLFTSISLSPDKDLENKKSALLKVKEMLAKARAEKDDMERIMSTKGGRSEAMQAFQAAAQKDDVVGAAKVLKGNYGLNALNVGANMALESAWPSAKAGIIDLGKAGISYLFPPAAPFMYGATPVAQGASAGRDATVGNKAQNFKEWIQKQGVDPSDEDAVIALRNSNPAAYQAALDAASIQGIAGGTGEGLVTGGFSMIPGGSSVRAAGGNKVFRWVMEKGKPILKEVLQEGLEEASVSIADQLLQKAAGGEKPFSWGQVAIAGTGGGLAGGMSDISMKAGGGVLKAGYNAARGKPAAPAAPSAPAAPAAPVAPAPVAPVAPTPSGPIAGEVPPAPAAAAANAAPAAAPAAAATPAASTPAAPAAPTVDPTIALQEQLASAQEVLSAYEAEKAKAEFEVEAANAALKDDPENAEKIAAAREAQIALDGKIAGFDAATKQVADITAQLEAAPSPATAPTPAPATPAPAQTAPAAQATPSPATAAQATPAPASPAPAAAPAPAYDGGDPRNDPRFNDLDRDTKSKLRRAYQFLLEQQQKLAERKAKNYDTKQKETQIEKIKAGIAATLGDTAPAPTAQAAPTAAPAPAPTPAPQVAPAPQATPTSSAPAPTAQADTQAAPDTQTQPTPAPQATPAPAPTPAPQATQPAPAPAPQAAPVTKPKSSLVEGLRGGLAAIKGRERSNAPAPQVQPSGTPASSDPRNDRRFEDLNRNLKQDVRVLHNKVINDEKAREKLIKEGRKTKNLDDRIAQNKEKIERILSGQPAAKPNATVNPDVAPIDPTAGDQTYDYQDTPAAPAQEQTTPALAAEAAPAVEPAPAAQEQTPLSTESETLNNKGVDELFQLIDKIEYEAPIGTRNSPAVQAKVNEIKDIIRKKLAEQNEVKKDSLSFADLNVPPAPASPGSDASATKKANWMKETKEWIKKYGNTHNFDGTVKSDVNVPPAPEAPDSSVSPAQKANWMGQVNLWKAKYGKTHNFDGTPKSKVKQKKKKLTKAEKLRERIDKLESFGDERSQMQADKLKATLAQLEGKPVPQTTSVQLKPQLFIRVDGKSYPVESLAEASEKWNQFRDGVQGLGLSVNVGRTTEARNFASKVNAGTGPVVIDQNGKIVGYISPNGKIRKKKGSIESGDLMYDPYAEEEAQAKAATKPIGMEGRPEPTTMEEYQLAEKIYEEAAKAYPPGSALNKAYKWMATDYMMKYYAERNRKNYDREVEAARLAEQKAKDDVIDVEAKSAPSAEPTPTDAELKAAAAEQGFTIGPVYHGTPTGGFTKFDPNRTGSNAGVSRGGPSGGTTGPVQGEAGTGGNADVVGRDAGAGSNAGVDPFAEAAADMIRQDAEDKAKNITTPVRRERGGLFDADKPQPNSELAQFYQDRIRQLDRQINQFNGNEELKDGTTGEAIPESERPDPATMEYMAQKLTRERDALAERLDAVRMGDAAEGNKLAAKTGPAFREEAKYARDKAKKLEKSAVTEKQKKLAADLKEAANGDPVTLMERITKILDAWELDVLGPDDKPSDRALSISPQALSAWAYRISKLIAKTGIKFGAWAKTMAGKMSKQNMKEVWSRAVAIARSPISLVKHFLDSRADKLWEYADRYENSATMRELANLIFTRSGPDADAVRNSIPQRIKQIRTQFANKYSNILNRFATEFSKMDEAKRKAWDRQFRRYVIGLDPLPSGDLGQAVIEFRQLMQEMLNYQKKAGIDMGDAGEGYFPRIWSSKKIQENIQKFYDAAKEMYRRRDERLLNKAIDEINAGIDAEAARKKDLDQKAGRRVKPDAEYQQDARDRADERIAELQAEHDAKDDAHYQQMAEDWAWRAQNGRLDEVSITDTNNKSANAPDHTDPRTFTAEEAAIADDFLDDDIDKTVMRYVSAAVKKSELARVFGKDGKVLAKMMIELGKDGVTEKERNHIKKLLQQSLDVSNNRLEGFDAEFFDWANFVVVSGYLGLSYINNLFLEPVSYGIRTGSPYLALKAVALTWQNFASELVRSVNDSNAVRKHYKNRKEFSKAMDMALAETLGLTHVELDRIAQDSHWDFNADAEESGSPTARWLTQRVLKANLMEQSERAKVATSMAIARGHILNVAKTFRGKSALQNVFSVVPKLDVNAESAARSMLREMGVDDSFHDSFCTFVESLKGMNDADYMAAVTGGSQEAILYRQALQRTSTGMAISFDPSMKTEGSDSIFGKMLMQLMNYSYAYSQLVKDHMYDSALGVFKKSTPQEQIKAMDRLKYAMPLLAGGTMTTVASLATKLLVTSIFPSDAGDEWLENEEEVMVLDAASYAGMFGKKFEYLSRMVIRKQVPMGPIPEAGGKAVIALATAIQKQGDSDRANYNALKSVQRTGITPLVVGGLSAVSPALGTIANYKMRDREFADAILEGLTGVEKPKK